jgi:hypothetical protein
MFNPLIDSFTQLTDNQIDEKIVELGRKYWQTTNAGLRQQILTILDMYREEAHSRRAKAYEEQAKNNNNDLDSLININ